MVDTYRADGTATTNLYSKPKNEEIHHKNDTVNYHWRIVNNALEVGKETSAGEFQREGMPRPLKIDADGTLKGIADWTRVKNSQD
jgi:hypothetical protein